MLHKEVRSIIAQVKYGRMERRFIRRCQFCQFAFAQKHAHGRSSCGQGSTGRRRGPSTAIRAVALHGSGRPRWSQCNSTQDGHLPALEKAGRLVHITSLTMLVQAARNHTHA